MADNVALAQATYDAFGRGDIPAVLGVMADDVEWHEAEHVLYWPGGPFIGPQAVVEGVFARIPQDYEGFTVNVRRLVGFGDTVIMEGRYSGRAKATDQDFDIQVAHVLDFRNGKLVRFQQYVDTLQLAQVMGVAPGVAAATA